MRQVLFSIAVLLFAVGLRAGAQTNDVNTIILLEHMSGSNSSENSGQTDYFDSRGGKIGYSKEEFGERVFYDKDNHRVGSAKEWGSQTEYKDANGDKVGYVSEFGSSRDVYTEDGKLGSLSRRDDETVFKKSGSSDEVRVVVQSDGKVEYKDRLGNKVGSSKTDSWGKTTYYDKYGFETGSSKTDNWGKTTFYDKWGKVTGYQKKDFWGTKYYDADGNEIKK